MFCPNSADWGSIADWVSGISTFAAVVAALWIASNQERSARRQRHRKELEEAKAMAAIRAEAIRLAGEVQALAASYVQLAKLGGGNTQSRCEELVDSIGGVQSQLEALQHFPMTDPRLFAEIGRLATECRLEPGLAEKSTSYAELVMRQLLERLDARRESLAMLEGEAFQGASASKCGE